NFAGNLFGQHRPAKLPDHLHFWLDGGQKTHFGPGWDAVQAALLVSPQRGVLDGVDLVLGECAVAGFPIGVIPRHLVPDLAVHDLYAFAFQGGTADAWGMNADILQKVMQRDGIEAADRDMDVPSFRSVPIVEGAGYLFGVRDLLQVAPALHDPEIFDKIGRAHV